MFNINDIKKQFPILSEPSLAYLDSASTTQKPQVTIDSLNEVYSKYNANVHRGMYPLALSSDTLWIKAHEDIAKFINAKMSEIFLVKNATEGLNWLALSLENTLRKDDVIVVTEMEHHSNYLPWLRLQKTKGITVEKIQITNDKHLDIESLKALITKYGKKIRLISLVHMSNVLGVVNDVKKVTEIAHENGSWVCIDGTQSIAHMDIDVKNIDCDFFMFSGHKIYGPNGVGVVYGKEEILENMEPLYQGGEMVESVSDEVIYSKLPWKFEAGTPNIADGIALSVALNWFKKIEGKFENELEISSYLYTKGRELEYIDILSPDISPVFTFNMKNVHPHDIASDLGDMDVCVRGGYHCVQPLHEKLGLKGSVRASLGIYSTKEDIDRFILGLEMIKKTYE